MKRALVFCFLLSIPLAWGASPRLSFDQALDQIVQRSTRVAIQAARVGETRARNTPTRLFYLPTVSLSAAETLAGQEDQRDRNRTASLSSRVNLFRFGADIAGLKAANLDEKSEAATLDSEVLVAEQSGVDALVATIQSQQRLGITRKLIELQGDSLQIAEARYKRGLMAAQEVSRISVDLSNTGARFTEAEIRDFEARAQVVALLGHSDVVLEWPWKERLLRFNPAHLEPELSDRPDWKAAEARSESTEQLSKRSFRQIFPSLDASLDYGLYNRSTGTNEWAGALTLSIPLFDRLTNYSNYRANAHAQAAAETALEEVRRTAKKEWLSARQAFEASLGSTRIREKTLAISRRLFSDAQKRFQAGRMDANELSLERERLLNSELASLESWGTVHVAFSRLCHAMGRRIAQCR